MTTDPMDVAIEAFARVVKKMELTLTEDRMDNMTTSLRLSGLQSPKVDECKHYWLSMVHKHLRAQLEDNIERVFQTKLGVLGAGAFGTVLTMANKRCKHCVKIPTCDSDGVAVEVAAICALHLDVGDWVGLVRCRPITIHPAVKPYILMPTADTTVFDIARTDLEPTQHVNTLVKQIGAGLAYLHANGYSHGDLSARNVLGFRMAESYDFKMCDFGATYAHNVPECRRGTGTTYSFASPEQALRSGQDRVGSTAHGEPIYGQECDLPKGSPPADVWAVGCLLLTLCDRRPPFMGDDPCATYTGVLLRQTRMLGKPLEEMTMSDTRRELLTVWPNFHPQRYQVDTTLRNAGYLQQVLDSCLQWQHKRPCDGAALLRQVNGVLGTR